MKKIIIPMIAVVVALGAWFVMSDGTTLPRDPNTGTYWNAGLGISFSYPKILNASTTSNSVRLHHDIPYQNTGGCDMSGETEIFERLTDFELTIRVRDKNLVDTVKENSPYITQENFSGNNLLESPGFIDRYSVGSWNGFAIYEGAEGCGRTIYYFPISSGKTLILNQTSIQILSGVISGERRDEVLSVPGVITPEESRMIFESILRSLKVL